MHPLRDRCDAPHEVMLEHAELIDKVPGFLAALSIGLTQFKQNCVRSVRHVPSR
jgi:hypothetical protein